MIKNVSITLIIVTLLFSMITFGATMFIINNMTNPQVTVSPTDLSANSRPICVNIMPYLTQGYQLQGQDSNGCPIVSKYVSVQMVNTALGSIVGSQHNVSYFRNNDGVTARIDIYSQQ